MFYSVCVSALFSRLPIQEGIARAKEAGYSACECWGWWDMDAQQVLGALKAHDMKLAAMCTRFVPLNDPARRQEYLDGSADFFIL